MKKGLFALGLIGLLGAFGVGCGNVCDDAGDVCGAGSASASGSSSAEVDCSGTTECAAQCIVDADSCDFTDEALAKCVTGCA